ncbi:MAG TPA: GMP synthase [Thermodesulfobacteriota bacterium]
MRLGILQCGSAPAELRAEFGDYPDMSRALLRAVDPSVQFRGYDLTAGDFPESLDECDGWLFTGSRWGVYDAEPWIARAADLARALDAGRHPTVGICFGHQLVAAALGGRVEKSSRGWGVGVRKVRLLAPRPPWAEPPADEIALVVSHQDQVVEPPPGARVLAEHPFCPYEMLQIGEHVLTIQAHPDFSRAYARRLMEHRRALIGEETYERGLRTLDTPTDSAVVGRWIVNFLRRACGAGAGRGQGSQAGV